MDAGPIWASRTFALDPDVPRKSTLYNGPVTDAAVALVHEVVAKAIDPGFVPEPLDYTRPDVRGRARPPVRQRDRGFDWSDPTEHVLRRIRAADGAPGRAHPLVRVPGRGLRRPPRAGRPAARAAEPGTVVARRHGAVLVRTGDGAIWIGHLRSRADTRPVHKLPATTVLADHLAEVPEAADDARLPRDRLPPRRPGRHPGLPVLQRRDVHRAVPPIARGSAPRHRAGHPGAAAARRPALLQRHPPGRHRRRGGPGRRGLGQHRRDRRRLRGDHHLRRPAGRVLDGRQRRRWWSHAGAGRRPGACCAPRRCSTRTTGPWVCTARSTGPTSYPAGSGPTRPGR